MSIIILPIKNAFIDTLDECQICVKDSNFCKQCQLNPNVSIYQICPLCIADCTVCNVSKINLTNSSENMPYQITTKNPTIIVGAGCPTNCTNCTTATPPVCTACTNLHGLSNGACISCSVNCTSCQADATNCVSCVPGTGPYYGACVVCSTTNCATCPINAYACSTCNSASLYLKQNQCVPCVLTYCMVCPAGINTCVSCMSFYGMNLTTGLCQGCNDTNCWLCSTNYLVCYKCKDIAKLGLDHTTFTCQLCIDINCLACQDDNSKCVQCNDTWGVDSSGACIPCHPTNDHCGLCNKNVSSCDQCMPRYGKYLGACQLCQDSQCINCFLDPYVCYACGAGFGIGPLHACLPCQPVLCQLCSVDYTKCTQCMNDSLHGLNPSSNLCVPCDTICITCDPTHYQSCIICAGPFFANNFNCLACPTGCSSCMSFTNCTACVTAYFLDPVVNTTQFMCDPCSTHCISCYYNTSYLASQCEECDGTPDIELVNRRPTVCSEICGDSYTLIYDCDNAEDVPFDGCNNTCEVEDNFTCQVVSGTGVTECSYNAEIVMEVIKFEKEKFDNKFKIQVQIYPPLYIFKRSSQQSLKDAFGIDNQNIIVNKVEYDPQNSVLKIDAEYTDTVDDSFVVYFKPSTAVDAEYFDTPPVIIVYPISAQNKLIFYSKGEFVIYDGLLLMSYVVAGLAWVGVVLGLFMRKLAGLEAMFVAQLGWLTVFWIQSQFYLTFSAVKPLRFVNGYHYPIMIEDPSANKIKSPHFEQFGLSVLYFVNNFNFELVLAIVAIIVAVATKLKLRHQEKKIDFTIKLEKQVLQYIVKLQSYNQFGMELLLTICLLNVQYYITCCVLFFKYGNIADLYSQLTFSFWTVFTLISLFLFIRYPHLFGYFHFSFIYKNIITLRHYLIYIFVVIVSAVLLAVVANYSFAAAIPYFIFFVYTFVQKPYKYRNQNYRSCFTLFVSVSWIGFKVFCQYFPYQKKSSFIQSLFLSVNLFLTLLCIIFGIISVIYYFKRDRNRSNPYNLNDPRYKNYRLLIQLGQVKVEKKNKKIETDNAFRKYLQPNMTLKNCSDAMKDAVEQGVKELEEQRKYFFKQQMRHPLRSENMKQGNGDLSRSNELNLKQHMIYNSNKNKIKSTVFIEENKMNDNMLFEETFDEKKVEKSANIPKQKYAETAVKENKKQEEEELQKKLVLKILTEQNQYINYKGAENYVNKKRKKKKKPTEVNKEQQQQQQNSEQKYIGAYYQICQNFGQTNV